MRSVEKPSVATFYETVALSFVIPECLMGLLPGLRPTQGDEKTFPLFLIGPSLMKNAREICGFSLHIKNQGNLIRPTAIFSSSEEKA